MKLSYLYAKIFKKYLRGSALLNCKIDKTATVESGCNMLNVKIGKYFNTMRNAKCQNIKPLEIRRLDGSYFKLNEILSII